MKTRLALIITATFVVALLLSSPVVAQTVIPGGMVHVGATDIANGVAGQVSTSPKAGSLLSSVKDGIYDNTYVESCVEVDGAGKTYIISVPANVIGKAFIGGWTPNQPYKHCPPKPISQPGPQSQPGDHFVRSTTPSDGDSGVSPSVIVKAEFSEPVLERNINTSNFVLRDPNGNKVPATVSYDPHTYTATLDPAIDLAEGATYTARINAKDAEGRLMQTPYSWSFTVGSCRAIQIAVPEVTCAPPS